MSFKTVFSFVLITAVFSAVMSACIKTTPFDFNEEPDILDFKGEITEVFQHESSRALTPEPGESAIGDSLLNHIKDVEKVLNININVTVTGNIPSRLLAAATSGNSSADIIIDRPNEIFDIYKANLLIPFDEIDVTDRTDIKWGTPAFLSAVSYNGNQYGVFPYLWCWGALPYVGGMFLVNMDIIEDNNFSDPHEYLEQGEWNWENMKAVFAQASYTDLSGQHIGMIFDERDTLLFPFVAIRSNGIEPISKTNGYYISNLQSERAMAAYDYLAEMISSKIIARNAATDDLFFDTRLYTYWFCSAPDYFSDDFKTGYIPFAYGPGGNKNTVSSMIVPDDSMGSHCYYSFSGFSKFGNSEIGIIADLLFDPVDTENYPNGWKDYCEANLFHYDIDFKNYVKAVEGVSVISIAQMEKSYKIALQGFSSFESGEAISSVISGISDAIQTEMNDKAK